MRVELLDVSKGRAQRALPETSVSFRTARASFARAETEQRPTVLGLLASGRMRPDGGRILIDGAHDPALLRRRVALVDAPDVSEPEDNVAFSRVAAEELMFAGRPAGSRAVRALLADLRLSSFQGLPIGNVPPAARLRLLCELAAMRAEVEGIVLVSPDRHGGDPAVWWALAEELAARGLAVLVIAGTAAWTALESAGLIGPDGVGRGATEDTAVDAEDAPDDAPDEAPEQDDDTEEPQS